MYTLVGTHNVLCYEGYTLSYLGLRYLIYADSGACTNSYRHRYIYTHT